MPDINNRLIGHERNPGCAAENLVARYQPHNQALRAGAGNNDP